MGVREVVVEPLGIHVPVDAAGRFSVRSLPAGKLTLRAGAVTRVLTLPVTPISINDVELLPESSKKWTAVSSADGSISHQ